MADEAKKEQKSPLSPALMFHATRDELLEEAEKVAAFVSHWGEQYGNAEAALHIAEAEYKHWKGSVMCAEMETEGGGRKSDSKLEAVYRSDPMYLQLNTRIAQAKAGVKSAMGTYNAYRTKADMIATALNAVSKDYSMQNYNGRIEKAAAPKTPVKG